jgi:alkylhydroperoxidase family enzyme
MGVPDDVISSCAQDPELADVPPSQREIIKFAVKAEENPKDLTDADYEVLRNQGLSDGEIAELIMMAGYAGMLDICADALGLEAG